MKHFGISPFFMTGYNDNTCIHMAAGYGKLELLKILMCPHYSWSNEKEYKKRDLMMMQSDYRLYTPLHEAAARHHLLTVKWIVEWYKTRDQKRKQETILGFASNKVLDAKMKDWLSQRSPYYFLFDKFSYRGVLPLAMSQKADMVAYKESITDLHEQFILTSGRPDDL